MGKKRSKQQISLNQFADTVKDALKEFSVEVQNIVREETEEALKIGVIIASSDGGYEGTGAYRNSITYDYQISAWGSSGVIYSQAPYYRLTHLLEKGHALRNGGRSREFPHWKPAEEAAIEYFEENVIRRIQNG